MKIAGTIRVEVVRWVEAKVTIDFDGDTDPDAWMGWQGGQVADLLVDVHDSGMAGNAFAFDGAQVHVDSTDGDTDAAEVELLRWYKVEYCASCGETMGPPVDGEAVPERCDGCGWVFCEMCANRCGCDEGGKHGNDI